MNSSMPLFLQGVLHPLMMPVLLLAMLGLGLLLGQQDKPVRLRSLPAAVITFLAGLFLANTYQSPASGSLILVAIAVLTGGLSATQLALPAWLPPAVAAICGFLIGFIGAPTGHAPLMLGGVAFTGVILMLLVIVFGCLLHRLLEGKAGLALGSGVVAGAVLLGVLQH